MKSIRGFVLIGVMACTPGQRQAASSALDVLETLCIISNQAMPDAKVAEICGITGPFIKPMQDILAGARHETAQAVTAARASAARCGDAGTP